MEKFVKFVPFLPRLTEVNWRKIGHLCRFYFWKSEWDSFSQSIFPSALKLANITPVHKKIQKVKKIITGPSVSYQIFLKYVTAFSLNKFQNMLNNFFPNINGDSEKVSLHNIACCKCFRYGNQLLITKTFLVLSSWIFPRHLTVSN